MTRRFFVLFIFLLYVVSFSFVFVGCSSHVVLENESQGTSTIMPKNMSFHYQLQNVTLDTLAVLPVAYVIVDPDDTLWTKNDISVLHAQNKTVIAYVSIGEAEDYRAYWDDSWRVENPPFVDEENKNWEGNYKVNYWDARWQTLMFDRVRSIMDLGYDGVYLDVVDAYLYYEEKGRNSAASEMISFISNISAIVHTSHSDALVISQNAVLLYDDVYYRSLIDGLGVESTWFENDDAQDTYHTSIVLNETRKALADGKLVFSIDYPRQQKIVCAYYRLCAAEKFGCLVADVTLDSNLRFFCRG